MYVRELLDLGQRRELVPVEGKLRAHLTGHSEAPLGAGAGGGVPPQGRVPLREEDVTVAEVLKSAGYSTGITGKWGLGEPGTEGTPNKQGFD